MADKNADAYCGEPNRPSGLRCSETEGHDSALAKEPTPHSAPTSPARVSALKWEGPDDEPQWTPTR
jgi:hypothetical protein